MTPIDVPAGRPPSLTHDELIRAQQETLETSRRPYGLPARILFRSLDILYGSQRTLSKFKVLELVARVPYQTWEQVAYIAITHVHDRTALARTIERRVRESREQQDNEQWHLFILQELIARSGVREGRILYFWIPQMIALVYYHVSWLLYVIDPRWSYLLNADFEDHAEHEYMEMVAENPHWESTPVELEITEGYRSFASLADLLRQIGHDERMHKQESIDQAVHARFNRPTGTSPSSLEPERKPT